MSDDEEFEDEAEFEEGDEADYDGGDVVLDEVEDDDALLSDDLEVLEAVVETAEGTFAAEAVEVVEEPETAPLEETDDEDDVVDLDEELHPDDVEEALDVVLRERTAKVGLEDEEEEDDEPDDPREGGTKIVPKRPGEFSCSSCFLVKPRHQLADEVRMLCQDCA